MSSSSRPAKPRRLRGRRRSAPALAAWLSPSVLLAVADVPSGATDRPNLEVATGAVPLDAHTECLLGTGGSAGGQDDALLVARLSAPVAAAARLTVVGDDRKRGPVEQTDLRALVRERLAWRSEAERERILELVVSTASVDVATPDAGRLGEALGLLRDALREPLPRAVDQTLRVDLIAQVAERRYFVRGQVRSSGTPVTRLTAVSPEGARVRLLPDRGGIDLPHQAGIHLTPAGEDRRVFAGCFTLGCSSFRPDGWLIEMELRSGIAVEAGVPPALLDPGAARDAIASELATDRPPDGLAVERAGPALARLQSRIASSVGIEDVEQIGEPPGSVTVTAVIPLARRADLIEHQLAQLADEPSLASTDLVYVTSRGRPAPSREALERLVELYRVPLRHARLSCDAGFAASANRGASLGLGRFLLLLRPDVIPRSDGWLGRLLAGLAEGERVGAVSPKLLTFDESIDHAGIYFRRPATARPWELLHRFRGLHRGFPGACVSSAVPAASAACLLVDRDAYLEVEGLNAALVGYEWGGPDLCLRFREAGLEIRYAPEAELYILDRESYEAVPDPAGRRYDAWLETSARGAQIGRLMDEPRFRGVAGRTSDGSGQR